MHAFLFWSFQRWWRMVHHNPWAAIGEQKVHCSHQVGKNGIISGYAYWASASFGFWLLKEEGRSFIDCILGHSQLLIFLNVYMYVCDCICKGVFTFACEFMCMYMWRTQGDVGDFHNHSPSCTLKQSLSTEQHKVCQYGSLSRLIAGNQCLYYQSTRIIGRLPSPFRFTWILGIRTGLPCRENTLSTEPPPLTH